MNVDRVIKRIVFMAREFGDFGVEYIMKLVLLDLGLPAHMEGFQHLLCGVNVMHENPDGSMTKEIYPAIARACGSQSSHVEIAIRRAIGVAWKERNEKWRDYFPGRRKPTNRQVLSTLVELMDIWEQCRDHYSEQDK